MEKEKIEYFKNRLENEKKEIEVQLKSIAEPDPGHPGQWKAKYPTSGTDAGHENDEVQANESDDYGNQVALVKSLAGQLADIDLALEKIAKDTYGKCENCDKEIPVERLEIFPAARLCLDCDKGRA